ncbi:unnamed protein product [Adineta ricciae]|uniref:SMP-30/Gluconolactonase/LRE-like region domain-containing protein n=1 Tax=Adineta ricciae TaxID=249248 RepID=A0A816AV62_ADIRI|nr:unnamed protein product [Adineta ricciae]
MLIKSGRFTASVVFVAILTNGASAFPLYLPKSCPTAEWSSTATTFANKSEIRSRIEGIFIDNNNTVYVIEIHESQILIWHEDRIRPMIIKTVTDLSSISTVFIFNLDEIYISGVQERVVKWMPSTDAYVYVTNTGTECDYVFIDIGNFLYCSMPIQGRVAKRWLDGEMEMMTVAGTGKIGSAPDELQLPNGIFVDTNSDLYVADTLNKRIQRFSLDDRNGETVAGKGSSDITIVLNRPLSIILDSDKYLFISDNGNNRIVASGPNGFRCLIGCDGRGQQSHQLLLPVRITFDIYKNMFVINDRDQILKFDWQKDSCKNVPLLIAANYSSILTQNHTKFSRTIFHQSEYHYETIEVLVDENGFYILTANSSIDLYGQLYKHYFDILNPVHNLIAWHGKCCNKDQFRFTLELLTDTKYILVVTTYNPNMTGPFSVTVFGPNTVHLERTGMEQFVKSTYTSALTQDHGKYFPPSCHTTLGSYYEAIQINVNESGLYTILTSIENMDRGMTVYIYRHDFYALIPYGNLVPQDDICGMDNRAHIAFKFLAGMRYVLVVSTCTSLELGSFSVTLLDVSSAAHSRYSSELTTNSQQYDKDCNNEYYYYQTVQLIAPASAYYALSAGKSSSIDIHIYRNHFDPLNPYKNIIEVNRQSCSWSTEIKHTVHLQSSITYVLLIITSSRSLATSFSIDIYGPTNTTLEHFVDNSTYCYVGGPCNTQVRSIGLTLDDILRFEVKRHRSMHHQSLPIKIAGAFTVIMFIAGVVNSACSILTFQNVKSRAVGCGLYLLASSVTSLLTITMSTIKFWFVVVTHMDKSIRLSVLEGGCKSIEFLLKLFFYWDAWLNACVAVGRGMNVYKGVSFDKEKSKRYARWIIFILPIMIVGTIIHEPLYRHIFKRKVTHSLQETSKDSYTWCITSYPQSVEDYNRAILFIHLLGPFFANLLSSLFIIIGSARRRAEAQRQQSYRQHIREQWDEHKQLVISPMILLLLSTPRLIISLLSGCMEVSRHTWLYVCGYFISFTPSILVFVVFVLPSNSYRKIFKETFFRICKRQR